MNVEIFAICDAATEGAGKLNILGAFDTLFASQLPSKHPACTIVARLRVEKSEEGEHAFKIAIIDQDGGASVPPLNGKINVTLVPGFTTGTTQLIVNYQGLELKKYGESRIDLIVDGQMKASIPLYIRPLQRVNK